ncbi:hypothetical protein [Streptomyces sp. NBC_00872]|uniref:hypothetical protein n=1 Tax=Streptomyces sp. NBC_00872 TaxID=2903686 RepID=UPI003866A452|nr:SMI1/KNR4 family protein [Streptomyces sp. NBC_00872]
MADVFEELLGERERFRPAPSTAWQTVEEWLNLELPTDYKELVNGYGDAIFLGHLFVPHPQGADSLLTFMEEERKDFHAAFEDLRSSSDVPDDVWARVVPWAYHDWNGDLALLIPPLNDPGSSASSGDEDWMVAVAYRQSPEIELFPGGITAFLKQILKESRFPRGWPSSRTEKWKSVEGSPLV